MKEKLLAVLKAVGISDEVSKLLTDESTDSTKVDEVQIITDFKANQLSLHENEPDIIKKIETKTLARERDKFDRKLKQSFGITAEEAKDKNTEDLIKLASEKANTNKDKTVEQLQNELIEKTNKIKTLEEVDIPTIRSEVDKHKKQFNVNDKLTKLVSSFELRNPLEDVLVSVQSHLGNSYDVDLDDKGEIVVRLKGSELLPKNADGTKFLTPKEIIQAKLESGQFLKQSNADDKKIIDKVIIDNVSKDKPDLTHIAGYEKAKANLELLKQKS